MEGDPVTLNDVRAAYERIRSLVHRTPVMTSEALDAAVGGEVFVKCEHLQRTGSFKIRGASNAIASLDQQERTRGVVTHSSGNHAQAVALAARRWGIPATVVMPENAPHVKRVATECYGATIVTCAPTVEAREEAAREVVERTGATFVHPYDDDGIIAGQGTAALELLEDVPRLDTILMPVGGGGLASGTTIVAHAWTPSPKVIACEPAGADDAARGLATGQRVVQQTPRTIADGLRTVMSERTFGVLKRHAVPVRVVDDEAIRGAMRFVWERMKQMIEPSGAVSVAGALQRGVDLEGKRVGVIVSGGNVDLGDLVDRVGSR